jgi:beta-lactamase class A
VLVIIVLAGGASAWLLQRNNEPDQSAEPTQNQSTTTMPEPPAEPQLPARINLQPVVDAWVSTHSGDYGIVVYDPAHDEIIAQHQPDKTYFMASIYKLYVAYLALMDIEAGEVDPDEIYRDGWTREKCLEEMIRSSHSPCGEQMMGEMGQISLNERLTQLGVTGNPFGSFETSAADVARLLARLQSREDLTDAHAEFLITAMREQIYRSQGMPADVPEGAMAVKTGFYETGWHDTGIIIMPDGREFIVAYLSQDAGSRQVADFGRTIYNALLAQSEE